MALPNCRTLKNSARQSLKNASCDPRQVVLIYAGAMALLTLVVTALDYLLEQQISGTGGLSGVGTRSILSTAQSVLRVLQLAILPFRQMWYLFFVFRIAQKQETGPNALAEGFHRFGPVVRLLLLQAVIYVAIALLCINLSSFLFMMTPWASSFVQTAAVSIAEDGTFTDTAALEAAVADAYLPIIGIFLVTFLLASAPVFYRLRFSKFWLMDHPDSGAFASVRASRTITKGKCLSLFKLDLSFWWFYALTVLVAAVSYGDVIGAALGVSFPWSDEAGYFVFLLLYLVLDLALAVWQSNPVNVTYAQAYIALQSPEAARPAPKQPNFPWNYE